MALWVPVFLLTAAIVSMTFGIEALPWQLSSEYFPTTLRPLVLSHLFFIKLFFVTDE